MRSIATAGVTYAVCTLAAAAGAKRLAKRRPATATNVLGKPIQVIEWQVDPKTPAPGSEKALAGMVGADVETSGVWDPLGFGKLYDRNFDFNQVMTYPHVQWLREAEIKHGRVCMLAFVGALAQQFWQIPGYPAEPDWTKALAACYAEKLPTLGVIQISVFAMLVEGRWYPDGAWIGQMDREPGDLGFDPLKYLKRPSSDLKELQLKELKNGRLAMIGLASLAANHAIPGSVPFLNGLGLFAQRREEQTLPGAGRLCGCSARSCTGRAAKGAAKCNFQWLKTGVKASDLAPTELRALNMAGVDVLVGKSQSGELFCVGNPCTSDIADVIGDVIVCPLHGSSFKTTTGELIDWCPSAPALGSHTEEKALPVFETKTGLMNNDIEVKVDTNARSV